MRFEHAVGAAEMHLKMLESKAQWKSETKHDVASQKRIDALRKARCPIKSDAQLSNAEVDAMWANKAHWYDFRKKTATQKKKPAQVFE